MVIHEVWRGEDSDARVLTDACTGEATLNELLKVPTGYEVVRGEGLAKAEGPPPRRRLARSMEGHSFQAKKDTKANWEGREEQIRQNTAGIAIEEQGMPIEIGGNLLLPGAMHPHHVSPARRAIQALTTM